MSVETGGTDPWPLRNLVLRTPRLELRPDDDDGARELAELALGGIHPPERMPFNVAWSDATDAELPRNVLQHLWHRRAQLRPDEWTLSLLVRLDGRVVGLQDLGASRFATTLEVSSGSWLGMVHQGQGIGTEMRAAILLFAFDHLGAEQARSGAFTDNAASLAVSRKLGYLDDGTETTTPRERRAVEQRLLLPRERFAAYRPGFTLEVEGLAACRPLLGI